MKPFIWALIAVGFLAGGISAEAAEGLRHPLVRHRGLHPARPATTRP